jgi:serine/threonine protein kinase
MDTLERANTKRFNMMEFKFEQIENPVEKEGSDYYTGKFFGQPVVLRYIGEFSEGLQSQILNFSQVNHSLLEITYGIVVKNDINTNKEYLYEIRELVEGKNFYATTNYSFHNKIVILYQIVSLIEYLHSFNVFYKFLKPTKILLYKDIKVKVLNLTPSNFNERDQILSSPLNDDLRFYCPDIYNPQVIDLEKAYIDIYNIGCLMFYAIYDELPWLGCQSKEEILKCYLSGESFFKDSTGKDEKVIEMIRKCLFRQYETVTELRKDLESLKEIELFKESGFVDFDYEKGIYFILLLENKLLYENINNLLSDLNKLINTGKEKLNLDMSIMKRPGKMGSQSRRNKKEE